MGSKQEQPLEFRQEDAGSILSKLFAGDSCSIVGIASVGKSNLLRHLRKKQVQQYHAEQLNQAPGTADMLEMVLIDPNNMLASSPTQTENAPSDSWAGYEIMMHRLYRAFYPFEGLKTEDKQDFLSAYEALRDGTNPILPHIGMRFLEMGLEILLSPESKIRVKRQLVFIFDEFEEMLDRLPYQFFRTLRGLRDDYKYQLMYVTFTRNPLLYLINEKGLTYDKYEPFIELFTDNIHYLGPYSESDALAMLDRLAGRHGADYSQEFRRFLLRVTGGYAGLLRASFTLAKQLPRFRLAESQALEFLADNSTIQTECETIWRSLSKIEQDTLSNIATNHLSKVADSAVKLLSAKKVLDTSGTISIEPPLLREYISRRLSSG